MTKAISFPVKVVGEGKDPWGGYRAGFEEGKTTLKLVDYGINYNLGPGVYWKWKSSCMLKVSASKRYAFR